MFTAEKYTARCKDAPLWAVGLRTVQRRHRDVLEPMVKSSFDLSEENLSKYPSGWDFYLEMPLSSLSNGESPVFLVGKLPPRKMRLEDGRIVSAPMNATKNTVDHSKMPKGSELIAPVIGEMNGCFVVKFFSHLQTQRTQNTEIAAHMMFSCLSRGKEMQINGKAPQEAALFVYDRTPPILAHGVLYELNRTDIGDIRAHVETDGWPYIVMPYIHGRDLLETFPLSSELSQLTESALFLGNYLRHLHQFEVGRAPKPSVNPLYEHGWRGFEKWLVKQRRIVTRDRPINSEVLTPEMHFKLDDYLPRDVRVLSDWYRKNFNLPEPRLIHNDLNEEHLLLVDQKPYAVLDFGDCRMGDPQYEWVAVFISGFRCNKQLLITALLAYYQLDSFETLTLKIGGWTRFSKTMMAYTLLHEQDAMRSVYNRRPELRLLDDFTKIQHELWDLSIPQPDSTTQHQ